MAEKTIRSHRARVKQANDVIKNSVRYRHENISIFDREAFVEYFLLEDITKLYKDRYAFIKAKKKETREGIFFQKKQLEKMHYLLYMLKKCTEVMEGKIDEGSFSDVWKAIHEHQLMVAAGNLKYLDSLVKLIEIMLGDIDREALEIAKKMLAANEFMDELEDSDANARRYYGLPSEAEVDSVISPVDVDIPETNSKNKPNPKIG